MALTILIFALVLSLLVFVHEMGHFLTARRFGVKVEEFGMGLPPRIFGLQLFRIKRLEKLSESELISATVTAQELPDGRELITEKIIDEKKEIDAVVADKRWKLIFGKREIGPAEPMVYSLNWIPVGGFVKIKGENGEASGDSDSFGHKKIWQRTIILSAGVTMNVALCILLLTAGFAIGMPMASGDNHGGEFISEPKVQITEVMAGYPASSAGLMAGDVIVSTDDLGVKSSDELKAYLGTKENQAVAVKILRGDIELEKNIVVVKKGEIIGFGIGIVDIGIVRYPWHLALKEGAVATWLWFMLIVGAVAGLFGQLLGGPSAGLDFAGPVGIAVMTGQAAKMGWIYVLQFTAMLSLNLAIINILPFPALDGGRILFLALEKIRGKAVDSRLENLFHNAGFILLMVLIAAITYRDLAKYGVKILQAVGSMVGL